MQNKFAIIGITIAVLVILGGIGLYLVNNNRSVDESNQIAATELHEEQESLEAQSISQLISNGGTIKCSYDFEEDKNITSAVIYIDGDRMRADVSTQIDGVDQEISMIRKDDKNYIWGSAFPDETGLLFESKLNEIGGDENYGDYIDFERKLDINCENWKVEEESFNTPENVEFDDLSGIIGEVIRDDIGGDVCSACNSLSEDAKNTCLTQLNCQ